MKIYINGESIIVERQSTIMQALAHYLSEAQLAMSFAIACNGDFIEKALYAHTLLNEGDSIDVLFPIQGG